jgi:RNA polymerase sigma-70 factor, ECF subfamily
MRMNGRPDMPRNPRDGPLEVTDFEEFAAQYRLVYPRLKLIAVAITCDAAQAEDIVQEAVLIAVSKIGQFRVGSNFSAWLAAIVRRCALNHRRKIRNRKTFATDPSSLALEEAPSAPSAAISPVNSAGQILPLQASFDDELLRALNGLTEDARCCLLLRVVQQHSYAEIAEMLEIPEGTAMSHVHRSKATLRKQLASLDLANERQLIPPQ